MAAGYELRPYQQEAREAIRHEWLEEGRSSTLLSLPTGTGKTVTFSEVAKDEVNDGRIVLELSHREELMEQAADTIHAVTGIECAIEKAERTSEGSNAPIIVGSVQSVQTDKRLERMKKRGIGTIIVDEAHHVLSPSYQKILRVFPNAHVLGVTATPYRGDMRNLGEYFESLAYEYDLKQAINDGYLCHITPQILPLKINLKDVRTQNGDYIAGDVGHALEPYLEQIADLMKTHCAGRRTLVFLPVIAISQEFRDILKSKGFRAAEVNGDSPDRTEIIADFAAGKYDVLCNSMLLAEGWDCPSVDCIIILRPTKSHVLYTQMVGRGTRLCPETGKEDLLLLDFLWLTKKHDLVRPAHLICKNQETADEMMRIIEKGDPLDLSQASEMAEINLIERKKSLAEELEAASLKIMEAATQGLLSPIEYAESVGAYDLIGYQPVFRWEEELPTEKQLSTIRRGGIYPNMVRSKGEASKLIQQIHKNRKPTESMLRTLRWNGFRNLDKWSFDAAHDMISRISANGWAVPADINPATYMPGKPKYRQITFDWDTEF